METLIENPKAPLTNDNALAYFERNGWNAEIVNGRLIAESFEFTPNGSLPIIESITIDVTGWSFYDIEDYFGFNDRPCNESTWDLNRN